MKFCIVLKETGPLWPMILGAKLTWYSARAN